jgi:hypothetical protein
MKISFFCLRNAESSSDDDGTLADFFLDAQHPPTPAAFFASETIVSEFMVVL